MLAKEAKSAIRKRFTPHDPLEDTERLLRVFSMLSKHKSFTPHDPLEDTERERWSAQYGGMRNVSPRTIR